MGTSVQNIRQRAEAAYAEGDSAACLRLGSEALASAPKDAALLGLTGRAALDLGDPASVELLKRLVEVAPDDATAWRDLGLAQLSEGDLPAAEAALREAVERAPDDRDARPGLTHVYRLTGRPGQALEAARRLAERAPDDVLALLDLGELSLEVGDHDAAADAFKRMRAVDEEQGHASYCYHAQAEVELRRQRWRSALDLTIAATASDRHQVNTDLLAYVTAKLFGEADRPAPPRAELERQLAERRAEHRRLHEEALVTERAEMTSSSEAVGSSEMTST